MICGYDNYTRANYAPFPVSPSMTPTLYAVESLGKNQYQPCSIFNQQNNSSDTNAMMMEMMKMIVSYILDDGQSQSTQEKITIQT